MKEQKWFVREVCDMDATVDLHSARSGESILCCNWVSPINVSWSQPHSLPPTWVFHDQSAAAVDSILSNNVVSSWMVAIMKVASAVMLLLEKERKVRIYPE